jgi:hypothetical protein
MGSPTAFNAQNDSERAQDDSIGGFFRSLSSPALPSAGREIRTGAGTPLATLPVACAMSRRPADSRLLFFCPGISRLGARARIFPGYSYFPPIEGSVMSCRKIRWKTNDRRSRSKAPRDIRHMDGPKFL